MDTAVQHDAVAPADHSVAVTDTHASTAAPAHGAEEAGGLPQFEFQHWGGQIVYLLFLFVLLYIFIARVFAPRMRRVIDERQTAISTAIDTARQVQAEAEGQAQAARNEVEQARAAARATAAAAKARANEEAARRAAEQEAVTEARISEAEARIAKTRDAALAQVSDIASDTARALVERLTGKAPTATELSAAVKKGA